MYLPKHFRAEEGPTRALLEGMGAADLVTVTASGLLATFLPLLFDPATEDGPVGALAPAGAERPGGPPAPTPPPAVTPASAVTPPPAVTPASAAPPASAADQVLIRGSLLGHVARANPQWSTPPIGEAMVIVHGPDAYVSPSWYPSKTEHGRVVPTWNYSTIHVYGHLVVHDDPDWVEALVRRLTERHEASRARPWSVDDAPEPYVAGQVRAIVGIEVAITRVESKAKWSQNRPAADIAGVEQGLADAGREDALEALRVNRG